MPVSNTRTMAGWFRRAAATASRRNRSSRSGSRARCSCSTLTATGRPRTSSRARQTVPIPPEATSASSSYLPARRRPARRTSSASTEGQSTRGPGLDVRRGRIGGDLGFGAGVIVEEAEHVHVERLGPFGDHDGEAPVAVALVRPEPGSGVLVVGGDRGHLAGGAAVRALPQLGGSRRGGGLGDILNPQLREHDAAALDQEGPGHDQAEDHLDQEVDDDAALVAMEVTEGGHRRRRPATVRLTSSNSSIRRSRAAPTKSIRPAATPIPTCTICSPRVSAPRVSNMRREAPQAPPPVSTAAARILPTPAASRRPSRPPRRRRRISPAVSAATAYAIEWPSASPRTPLTQSSDSEGSSAVMIDTEKIACGSWKKMNAA